MTYEEWQKYFKTLENKRLESLRGSLENLMMEPEIKKAFGGDLSGLIYCIQTAQTEKNFGVKI